MEWNFNISLYSFFFHFRMPNISSRINANQTETRSDTITLVSSTFLIIIIIMALCGNLLVVVAFQVFSKLRTVTNYFIVSLAVADILVAGLSMPVWLAYLVTGPEWIFADWLQQAWGFVDILCGVASIMHLCFISVERNICISSPLSYHEKMTTKKALVSIGVIWMFSVFMALLKVFLWDLPPPVYELTVTILCFLLPLLVMLISYMNIFRAARHQIKKMTLSVHGQPKRFLLSKELKAAKIVAVVIGAFLVCWCPFFVLNLVYALCVRCRPLPHESLLVAKWMHYVNSVLNPIIYACMNKDFRSAFKKLLTYSCTTVSNFKRLDMVLERSSHSERSSLKKISLRSKGSGKSEGEGSIHPCRHYQEEVNYSTCNNDKACYV